MKKKRKPMRENRKPLQEISQLLKGKKKSPKVSILGVLLVMILLMLEVPVNTMAATKASSKIELNNSKVTLVSGESIELKVKSRPYKKSQIYDTYWYSSDTTVVSVDEKGKLTGLAPGTATITVYEDAFTDDGYVSESAECKVTVKQGAYTLNQHSLTLIEEESVSISIPENVSVEYELNYDYESYPMGYGDVYEDEETKDLIFTAYSEGTVYLDVTFYDADGTFVCVDRCKIVILRKGIDTIELTKAVGKTYEFQVNGYEPSKVLSWTSEDSKVATISQAGKMTAISEGETYIKLLVEEEDGTQREYSCTVYVSNPKLKQESQNLALDCSNSVEITGMAYTSELEATSSKPEIVEVDGSYIYAKAKGSAVITYKVDGVKLKYKVRVTNPTVKSTLLAVVKGKSSSIQVTGVNSYSEISYETSNKKVATVSKSGKIKAVKNGSATITVTADGKTFYVPVSVSNKKVVSTLNYALSAIGSSYSQDKRMSTGFYDCSSLAWRSYHTAGVNFGNSSWAPTAAGIAEYLVKNKKVVAYKAVSPDKMQPGDLIFFARENNGRYLNIYHVAIYAGTMTQSYGWFGADDTYTTGLLLEARNEGVGLFQYYEEARNVVLVARPTK